jgi:serine/threonine-protein kinase HipA
VRGKEHPLPILANLIKPLSQVKNYETGNIKLDDLIELSDYASSIGGAEPKFAAQDDNGELYIVKVARNIADVKKTLAKEASALELAALCGIKISEFSYTKNTDGEVIALKRFDRALGGRIPYLSLNSFVYAYPKLKDKRMSYAYIGDILQRRHDIAAAVLPELFKRACVNFVLNNQDDHLKNTGFLFQNGVWELSPAFDITIEADPEKKSPIPADFNKSTRDRQVSDLVDAHAHFNLDKSEAADIAQSVSDTIGKNWQSVFAKYFTEQNLPIYKNLFEARFGKK